MAKTLQVGDSITLPSGRVVLVTAAAVPARPWHAIETGYLWHVCREHGIENRPSVSFYFGGKRIPMQLDEEDARALAMALNQARAAER